MRPLVPALQIAWGTTLTFVNIPQTVKFASDVRWKCPTGRCTPIVYFEVTRGFS